MIWTISPGWNWSGPTDPDVGSVDGTGRYAGHQGQDQQQCADCNGNECEPAQKPMVFEEPRDGGRDENGHGHPLELISSGIGPDGCVQTLDHGDADTVQGHRNRNYQRSRVTGPRPQDQGAHQGQSGQGARLEEDPDVGASFLCRLTVALAPPIPNATTSSRASVSGGALSCVLQTHLLPLSGFVHVFGD